MPSGAHPGEKNYEYLGLESLQLRHWYRKLVVLINFSRATVQITFSMASPKNRVWTPNLDLRKNRTPKNGLIRETGPTGLKLLVKMWPFGSSYMKEIAEMIHFNIKSRDV